MVKISFTRFTSKEFIITALLYIVFFLFLIHAYRDYDWGWHYRYGEYFFQNGKLLLADPFSWTMPGYVWANHSWAFDPLLYVLYSVSGFTGLTVSGAAVSFLIFIFGTIDRKVSYWKMAILMLFFANISSGVIWQGLRSQMIGVLFLSFFLLLLRKLDTAEESTRKKIFIFLPILFLLWVNFHGYFLIGLVCFGISIFCDLLLHIKEIKKSKKGLFVPKDILIKFLILLLCFFATFINPFTFNVYFETFRHSSSSLLPLIQEWMPVPFFTQFYAVVLIYSILLLAGFLWKRDVKQLKWFLIAAFAFFLTTGARRYNLVYAAASLPLAMYLLQQIPWKLEKYKTTFVISVIALIIGLEIALFRRLPNFDFYSYDINSYCRLGSGCSEKLTNYLIENPPVGRGFNFYDWGGYMIGRGVPFKLFIDGRMHLWERADHFQPFLAYQNMYYDKNFELFRKYDFDWYIGGAGSSIVAEANKGTLGFWEIKYVDGDALYMVRDREKEKEAREEEAEK